ELGEIWAFVIVSIPTMILLGLRHALDVDHITAIDNLVRLHNAVKKSRWVGAGFSLGHMLSVLAEMIFIIYIIGSITTADVLSFWGGVIGAVALAAIGAMNVYAMKKWGKTSSTILASKILSKTGMSKPFSSALVTGMVFGLGFDTATQISAVTLSAVGSFTFCIQGALLLSGFFSPGIVPLDILDSVALRSAFSKISNTRGLRYMSYGLSGAAMTVASIASYEMLTKKDILPEWTGASSAGGIIGISFAYSFLAGKRKPGKPQ